MKKNLIIILMLCMSCPLNAQKVSYKVLEADVDVHKGFVGLGGAMFLGGATVLGISADARAQYDLDQLPLTLWFQGHRELVGVGHIEREGVSYTAKPMELNLGVMYPLIAGEKENGKVKIVLESSYGVSGGYARSYNRSFKAKGEVKTDILAKAGLYSYSSGIASNAGLTLGICRRKREHTKIEYNNYIYDTHYDKQLYLDLIFAPINNLADEKDDAPNQQDSELKASVLGARIGFQQIFYGTRSINYEVSMRPYSNFYLITLAARFTFGLAL
ncbi:hypothetical protein [Marivirga atlantica]|uniref:Outer membrane protein beta-barrel domain-containing protein n=1 Tax=Marivirga atlantica TaxID=1548457 RepID=A0A937DKD6_9BACT|nr:hypothetical protein [Marivirga atlantica]MBL0766131.1 hypothetical protein [Marivirga atlantica]